VKPRHADLLASDLDDKTLIRFIDRFLMFYIRTGDRLQRTATLAGKPREAGVDTCAGRVRGLPGIGRGARADMQKLVTLRVRMEEGDRRSRDHEALPSFRDSDEPD